MGAQIRVYRQKISSTTSMRKIFKAMELIATSRIGKARARVAASLPYANAITRAVSAVASQSEIDHPLTTEPEQIRRAAVLVITSDRGLAGSYSASVLKQAEGLNELLHAEGKEVKTYLVGRKAQAYFDFRNRPYERVWTGGTDAPEFATAREIGEALLAEFAADYEDGGVDEIHVVYTRFKSMVTQEPTRRSSPRPVKSVQHCSPSSQPTTRTAALTRSTSFTPASSRWSPRNRRSSVFCPLR
jgi:F-type H+-transporting ATPase subunit gamma